MSVIDKDAQHDLLFEENVYQVGKLIKGLFGDYHFRLNLTVFIHAVPIN